MSNKKALPSPAQDADFTIAAPPPFPMDEYDERRWVVMSNALAASEHSLTLAEKRLVMLAVSRLNPLQNDLSPPTVKIFAKEFAEFAGLKGGSVYEHMREAAANLFHREIVLPPDKEHQHPGKRRRPSGHIRWVGAAHYLDGEGAVVLKFWPEVMVHLVALREHFTKYQLRNVRGLRSTTAWRLLEMLFRYRSTGYAVYSVEDLGRAFQCSETQLKNFNYVKRRIIEPAISELKKNGWEIDFSLVKRGRKVASVTFRFEPPAPPAQPDLFEKDAPLSVFDIVPLKVAWV